MEPYAVTPGADTYELTSCYNGKWTFLNKINFFNFLINLLFIKKKNTVTVNCESRDMTAHVLTNRLFSGKVYGKLTFFIELYRELSRIN